MQFCLSCFDNSTGPDGSGHLKIAYTSDVAGSWDIYTIAPDGTKFTRLTDSDDQELDPICSADGKFIYYRISNAAETAIYRMDTDGSDKVRLTEFGSWYNLEDLSADGTKLLLSAHGATRNDIYIMYLQADSIAHVTTVVSDLIDYVRFTPDGQNILYTAMTALVYHIYMVSADGSTTLPIADEDSLISFDAVVSPDGSRIAYVSADTGDYKGDIFLCDINGNNKVNVSSSPTLSQSPCWSPDGMQLIYLETVSGGASFIMKINADGTGSTCLTDTSSYLYMPQWSPDGSQIAYIGNGDGDPDVYVMTADGSNKLKLTDNTALDQTPTWSPAR